MPIKPEHLDELLAGYEKPEDLLGEDGLFKQLKKALLERALGAELTHHLGYEKGDPGGRGTGNNRNGTYGKTVLTEDGAVEIDVPRDRNGSFEPQIVAKGETRLDGFDDKIISLYARGMTVREIQGHLRELYAVDVSPDLISRVTDAVLDEVREWQNRPLDTVYPVVFFDALRVKIRDESVVKNKAVYLALALDCEGHKHVLGLWIEQSEGCAYQKLNPTILMMKSAEDRPNNELAKALDWPTARRILVQRQVRSAFVVIAGVGRSDPAQMALAEDNRMIKALPADRADQSFRIPVLPR